MMQDNNNNTDSTDSSITPTTPNTDSITTSTNNTTSSTPGMDRRDFLKTLGILGVVAAGSTSLLSGCMTKAYKRNPSEKAGATRSFDLVIVGAGGTGLAAAITAFDAGVKEIIILERQTYNGGNTNFSSSGMNASETKFQKKQDIKDSNQLFIDETYTGGKEKGDKALVEHLCNNSAEAIDWLDGLGITLDNITQMAGASLKRCHRPTDGSAVGKTLVPSLVSAVGSRGIPIENGVGVSKLIMKEGRVDGVELENGSHIAAGAVILATGGFGANFDMIAEYRPDLKDFKTTNAEGTKGDGMRMAHEAGAALVDMDQIQIHPTVADNGSLIAEGIRGGGAILVNTEGKRFIDELKTRDVVSAAELKQPGGFAYVLYDAQVYGSNKEAANYEKLELSVKADTLEALAKKLKIDAAALQATVAAYNACTTEGKPDAFERKQGMIALEKAPFYACKVSPGIHHCMGGIRINTRNQALKADGTPLPALFAAGETTGGIHGANRLGGNAVCDIMVNGRQAGRSAVEFLNKK
ncbi:MAG: flavocytochrome c [Coriobacteriales bacterium]|jgi:fumarate reductase flavoprotein subunit|nr:flavocytochrome c [Coriobacteriales bacterium]